MGSQIIGKKNGYRSYYLIAAIICTIGVFILSVLPPQSLSPLGQFQFRNLDKMVHTLMYAVLTFLWFKAINKGNFSRSQSGLILIIVIIYGVLMEFTQLLIKGRSFEWEDMLSNTVGAILGIVIASLKMTSAG